MKKLPIRLIALAAGLALIFATFALASSNRKVWCAGNICVTDDGGISPSKLPRHGKAPVTARLNAEISTRDGSHPPPFEAMDLEVEKTIGIDAVGLPTCRKGEIVARTSAEAKRACADAIVGSGEAEVEVAFPEQAPFRSTGPLVLFNGGVQGPTTTLFLHAYVNVPAPTAIVVKATVTRIHRGRFGLHILAKVPKIAGGAGSVTNFNLKVGRRFTYEGKRKSFLVAGCPTGTWLTKGDARFGDGTRLSILHAFPCVPVG
ncbi:MAG TPA: hypothetical protein VI039_04655 [Solirubrobacterales bacterium]